MITLNFDSLNFGKQTIAQEGLFVSGITVRNDIWGNGSNYGCTIGNETASFNFDKTQKWIEFDWMSCDATNTITIFNGSDLVFKNTGGFGEIYGFNKIVEPHRKFSYFGNFDRFEISSETGFNFELDNIRTGIPEPGCAFLFCMGLALLLIRRK